MSYKKPILNEIYSQIYFKEPFFTSTNFLDILPNILMPKIRETISEEFEFEFVNELGIVSGQKGPQIVPRLKCWNKKRTHLIQIFPSRIVINLIGEYPGWIEFVSFFDKVQQIIKESKVLTQYKALSLTTIDKFDVSSLDFTLGKYLNCTGEKIPRWYNDSKEASDIDLGRGFLNKDKFNRQIKVQVRQEKEKMVINIISSFRDGIFSDETNISGILEKLHDESNDSFESLITDITRKEIMGGLI